MNERRILTAAIAASLALHGAALTVGSRLHHIHVADAPPPLTVEILPPQVLPPQVLPPIAAPVPAPAPVAVPPAPAKQSAPLRRDPVLAVPQEVPQPSTVRVAPAERQAEPAADEGDRRAATPLQDARPQAPGGGPSPGAALTPPVFNAAYLRNPPPRYPASARREGQQGTVTLRVLVTPDGTASRVELERSSGAAALDSAALEAVKNWRFVPARRGTDPVEAWVLVPVVFRLDGNS